MREREFNHSRRQFADLAGYFTDEARRRGATHTEIEIEESDGIELTCEGGELESVSHMNPVNVTARLWMGAKSVTASVQDFSRDSVDRMLDSAMPMLAHIGEEDSKLPVEEEYEPEKALDFDLYHPFHPDVDEALSIAVAMEKAGLAEDPRIVKSTTCEFSYENSHVHFLNSRGLERYEMRSCQSLSACFMAKDGEVQETGYHYDVAADYKLMESPEAIGRKAAGAAVAKLDARPIPTGEYPVVYDSECSSGLLRLFFDAISGYRIYYGSTFLVDAVGRRVFPQWLTIREDPHARGRLSSQDRDGSGVRTRPNLIVENGVVRMTLNDLYYARKLGVEPTGHGGGVTNIETTHTHQSREELLREMGTGVLITELQGSSVNLNTGNYSQGVEGFWIEDGKIVHAINESTVGGNLGDMWMNVRGSAGDSRRCRDVRFGSVWIGSMVVGSGVSG